MSSWAEEARGLDAEPGGVGPARLRRPGGAGDYARFYEGVVRSLREVAPPAVAPPDAVLTLEVTDAARRATTGRVVKLVR